VAGLRQLTSSSCFRVLSRGTRVARRLHPSSQADARVATTEAAPVRSDEVLLVRRPDREERGAAKTRRDGERATPPPARRQGHPSASRARPRRPRRHPWPAATAASHRRSPAQPRRPRARRPPPRSSPATSDGSLARGAQEHPTHVQPCSIAGSFSGYKNARVTVASLTPRDGPDARSPAVRSVTVRASGAPRESSRRLTVARFLPRATGVEFAFGEHNA